MIWTKDYNTLSFEISISKERRAETLKRAFEYAKSRFFNRIMNMEDFIVIHVDGYDCIAYVIDEFNPIEIHPEIYPFDEEKVYPAQELELKYQFRTDFDF